MRENTSHNVAYTAAPGPVERRPRRLRGKAADKFTVLLTTSIHRPFLRCLPLLCTPTTLFRLCFKPPEQRSPDPPFQTPSPPRPLPNTLPRPLEWFTETKTDRQDSCHLPCKIRQPPWFHCVLHPLARQLYSHHPLHQCAPHCSFQIPTSPSPSGACRAHTDHVQYSSCERNAKQAKKCRLHLAWLESIENG